MPYSSLHTRYRIGFIEQIKRARDRILLSYMEHRHNKNISNNFPRLSIANFDHIGLHINYFGRYEHSQLSMAMEFIENCFPEAMNKAFIDAGANIGNHTVFFSEKFNNVLAFEPVSETFDLLKLNTKNRKNVQIFNCGLSDSAGRANMVIPEHNNGGARIERCALEGDKQADLVTLDSIVAERKLEIGLLKIDVEGHEVEVLEGSKELLFAQRPIVMFEQLEDDINGGNSAYNYLRSAGYAQFFEVRTGVVHSSRILRLVQLFTGVDVGLVELNELESRTYSMILAVH